MSRGREFRHVDRLAVDQEHEGRFGRGAKKRSQISTGSDQRLLMTGDAVLSGICVTDQSGL